MYQNVIYSSDEENDSNDNSYNSSSTYDDNDAEKRNYYLNKLQELENKVNNNNFQDKEKNRLLNVINYVMNMSINWDKEDNMRIDNIDGITKVILPNIIKQMKLDNNNEDRYRIVTDIINTCKQLKQDLKEVLI